MYYLSRLEAWGRDWVAGTARPVREISNSVTAVQFVFRPSCSLCSHAPCPFPSLSSSPPPLPTPPSSSSTSCSLFSAFSSTFPSLSSSSPLLRAPYALCPIPSLLSSPAFVIISVVLAVLRFLKHVSLSFVTVATAESAVGIVLASSTLIPIHSSSFATCSPLSDLPFWSSPLCLLPGDAPFHLSIIISSTAVRSPSGLFCLISVVLPPHLRLFFFLFYYCRCLDICQCLSR